MHILPKGLVRIWHFSILGGSAKQTTIPLIHTGLGIPIPKKRAQILGNLQSNVLLLMPEGKHGQHLGAAHTGPGKGGLFRFPSQIFDCCHLVC
jgi:hypothetical protein